MNVVLLASPHVSSIRRQHEVVADLHRPRLIEPKKQQQQIEPLEEDHSDFINDQDHSANIEYCDTNEQENSDPELEETAGENQEEKINFYIGEDDDQLNQELNVLNNNEHNYYLNKKPIGRPVQAFPPSLIQWPPDNSSRTKRLADIRKQVKLLSNVIKMTIDNDKGGAVGGALGGRSNPPFTSFVTSMKDQSFASTSSASSLPTIEDIKDLLKLKKNKEIKTILRSSSWPTHDPIRAELWKVFCQHIANEEFTDTYYWETVQQMYGSKDLNDCHVMYPAFIDQSHLHSYCLSEDGVKACNRIISVIAYSFPAITYAPLLFPITALFLHYMPEPDAYNSVVALISKSSNYISQTKTLSEATWRTIQSLSRKHTHGSYAMLQKLGISDEQTDEGFQQWVWWLFAYLPLPHLVRIIDCFLWEESKIFIRCSMAIFHLYMRQVSKNTNAAATITTKGFSEAISSFCKNFQFAPNKLLKSGFGIKALGRKEIKKIQQQSEENAKNVPGLGGGLQHSNSLEGLPTSRSQENIQMMSHTLVVKELLKVWSWLPMRMTMLHPTLIYTTEEHGSSLRTFYNKAERYEPTLLIVRTIDDYVFGAYCSTAWFERNTSDEHGNRQTYFGTGETFLFTLKPEPVKYEWVGITKQRKNAHLSSVAHSEELYMHADNDMVSIGGGQGHGLMLDHELTTGKTETCETYNNPPLYPEGNFTIKVVEVYGLVQN